MSEVKDMSLCNDEHDDILNNPVISNEGEDTNIPIFDFESGKQILFPKGSGSIKFSDQKIETKIIKVWIAYCTSYVFSEISVFSSREKAENYLLEKGYDEFYEILERTVF